MRLLVENTSNLPDSITNIDAELVFDHLYTEDCSPYKTEIVERRWKVFLEDAKMWGWKNPRREGEKFYADIYREYYYIEINSLEELISLVRDSERVLSLYERDKNGAKIISIDISNSGWRE